MNDENKVVLAHILFPDQVITEDAAKLLHNAAAGEQMCRLKYAEEGYVQDLCMLVHKDRTWIYGLETPDIPVAELTGELEVQQACARILGCSEAPELGAPLHPALLMSRQRFEIIHKTVGTVSLPILSLDLVRATGDMIQAPRLAKVLKACSTEGEIWLCSRSGNGWVCQYAHYVADSEGGFLLRMSSRPTEDWMIASPLSKTQFCALFTEWLLQAGPLH